MNALALIRRRKRALQREYEAAMREVEEMRPDVLRASREAKGGAFDADCPAHVRWRAALDRAQVAWVEMMQ